MTLYDRILFNCARFLAVAGGAAFAVVTVLFSHQLPYTVASLAFSAALLASAVWLTRQMRPQPVSRKPDYALIASMEREVYGEAFRHDGAPETRAQRRERSDLDWPQPELWPPDSVADPAGVRCTHAGYGPCRAQHRHIPFR